MITDEKIQVQFQIGSRKSPLKGSIFFYSFFEHFIDYICGFCYTESKGSE